VGVGKEGCGKGVFKCWWGAIAAYNARCFHEVRVQTSRP
jgi:hypothetical protein